MSLEEKKKAVNPIRVIWNLISTISGALSLINIASDWASWGSYIDEFLTYYNSFLNTIFGWLPFVINGIWRDYLFIGLLFVGVVAKVTWRELFAGVNNYLSRIRLCLFVFSIILVAWAPFFVNYSFATIFPKLYKSYAPKQLRYSRDVTLWFFASVILFAFALIVSVLFRP